MTFSDWLGISGVLLTIASTFFGFYQYFKTRKYEKFVEAQLWSNFHKTYNTFAICQGVMDKYKDLHQENINPEMMFWIGRQDAFSQLALEDVIMSICNVDKRINRNNLKEYLTNKNVDVHEQTKYMMYPDFRTKLISKNLLSSS